MLRELTLYINAFLLGSIIMGFEMLGSRYLYPYYGGGIGTWGALIATVLAAITVGYYVGGALADRFPKSGVAALLVGLGSIYLMFVPTVSDGLLLSLLDLTGDGPSGVIAAAFVLLFIPLSLLATFVPFAMRLMLRDTRRVGRLTGVLYAISTSGNIFGTLFVTFTMIPAIGSRAITYWLAGSGLVSSLSLFSLLLRDRDGADIKD